MKTFKDHITESQDNSVEEGLRILKLADVIKGLEDAKNKLVSSISSLPEDLYKMKDLNGDLLFINKNIDKLTSRLKIGSYNS